MNRFSPTRYCSDAIRILARVSLPSWSRQDHFRQLWQFVCAFLLCVSSSATVCGQGLPKQDVIEVPAIPAGLAVSNLFQSNMVLQRDKPLRIWGWATAQEEVTVEFAGNRQTAITGPDGRWQVTLPPTEASSVPGKLTVQGASSQLVLENLLVGDVWILGGQSNMEFELAKVENGALEIVSANYPKIRILTVPYGVGPEEKLGFARLQEWSDWFSRHFRKGDWQVCSPETVRELSAIGYVFARRIHKASNVPIGVIDASRGGTTVEAWTPLDKLRSLESDAVQAKLAQFDEEVADWDPAGDQPDPRENPNYPGNSYAGMIAPLAGLAVKGVIFHQGYNNAFEGSLGVELYRDVFPEMIHAWRDAFDDSELAFGILSLCTDGYPQTLDDYCEKMHNAGIEIRAAQYQTFLDLRNGGDQQIGFASSYDLRRRWYHPQLKIPAGERLARWALATQYGFARQIEWLPPQLVSMDVEAGTIQLTFSSEVGDPQEGDIVGFAIAGEDRKFQPAKADYAETGKDDRGRVQYDRRRLVLTSPLVPQPVHFRYAWGRNPLANLQAMGHKDLPVATQRSDDWPMEQVPLGIVAADAQRPLSGADRNKILQALRQQDIQRRREEARAFLETH